MDYTVSVDPAATRKRVAGAGETQARRGENGLVTEPWMIDELAYAGPEHLDPAFVAGYDRKQGYPDPGEDLAIFEAHGLGRASAVLDLAAGSGQFALAAARRFGHVTAVDVSPAMNALLRERATAAGLANLDCVRAGFLSHDYPGPPVDGVYTRNALHQLPTSGRRWPWNASLARCGPAACSGCTT
jgi:SAM-dependent methyltransferase